MESVYATAAACAKPFLDELAKNWRDGNVVIDGREDFFSRVDDILDHALKTAYAVEMNTIKAELVSH